MKEEQNKDPQPILQVSAGEAEPVAEPVADEAKETTDAPSLQQLIRETVTEEDAPLAKNNVSLKKILWGEFLTAEIVRRQIWLIILITFFIVIYIAERYSYQKYLVEIDNMTKQLEDAKFRALSSNSELTERTRQSKVLDMLKANNDSLLKISDRPPYYIKVPE